jgi:hypothetical protein
MLGLCPRARPILRLAEHAGGIGRVPERVAYQELQIATGNAPDGAQGAEVMVVRWWARASQPADGGGCLWVSRCE